jgi:hypothetical protein
MNMTAILLVSVASMQLGLLVAWGFPVTQFKNVTLRGIIEQNKM